MWFSGRGLSAFGGYALRAALSAKGRYAPLFFVWRPVPHVFRFFCVETSPPCFSFFLWGDQSPHAPRNANREHGVAMFPVRIS